jgi:saccharopine dehydrogenase-like NADP-dependent oxidoreductase
MNASARPWPSGTAVSPEEPLTGFEPFDFPELGVLNCYYVDHEESQTLPRVYPQARTIDFKLCMDDVTVETLRVMKRLGLSGRTGAGGHVGRAA